MPFQLELAGLFPLSFPVNKESGLWKQDHLFKPGERILLSAPSGGGKTSFAHFLFGLRFDYQGTIKLDGQIMSQISLKQWTKWRQEVFSVIFQDLRLFGKLSALENILVKQILLQKADTNRITDLAKLLGIAEVLYKKASFLSFGEKQRVAILRALCGEFQWLIMDEPFAHLDNENTKKAVMLIDQVCREKSAGLILTSHHENDYFDYTRRIRI